MQPSVLIKIIIIEIVTVLKVVSALAQVKTQTELGNIMTTAVHCLYCNPGYYPHGLLWYAIMIPIAYFGNPTSDLISLASVDLAISMFLLKKNSLLIPFQIVTFISYFVIPQNEPIMWLILLGLYSPVFLSFSILAKLPVGAPWADWNFIFHTSLNIVTNFQDDYGLLVGFWLWIFAYYYRNEIKLGWKYWTQMRHKTF